MFQNSIISNELLINNFFKKLSLDLYLTKPQLRHVESIMNSTILKGYNGKISGVAEFTLQRHRTSITRFLSNSNWDETLLNNSLKLQVLDFIWSKSRETNKPIYFIIDDYKL